MGPLSRGGSSQSSMRVPTITNARSLDFGIPAFVEPEWAKQYSGRPLGSSSRDEPWLHLDTPVLDDRQIAASDPDGLDPF